MAPKFAGTVVDRDGAEIEVWTELGPDNHVAHVFLTLNDSQVGDFAFGQPRAGDKVEKTAQRVAAGEAKRLTVFYAPEPELAAHDDDDFAVIDEADSQQHFKTLRSWPGDGRRH